MKQSSWNIEMPMAYKPRCLRFHMSKDLIPNLWQLFLTIKQSCADPAPSFLSWSLETCSLKHGLCLLLFLWQQVLACICDYLMYERGISYKIALENIRVIVSLVHNTVSRLPYCKTSNKFLSHNNLSSPPWDNFKNYNNVYFCWGPVYVHDVNSTKFYQFFRYLSEIALSSPTPG